MECIFNFLYTNNSSVNNRHTKGYGIMTVGLQRNWHWHH